MEDFKKLPKMQHFKTGGSVKPKEMCYGGKMKEGGHLEETEDVSQDKKLIKKAFSMHDKQEHEGEKTDLSKLRKGGRAKKDCGSVRKYKTGGSVENAYGDKKTDKDIKDIANTKRQKPAMLCGGKSVKKMADGRLTGPLGAAADMENLRMLNRASNARKYLGPAQQSQFVKQGGMNPAPGAAISVPAAAAAAPVNQMGDATGMGNIPYRKGGKVKKDCK